MDIRTTALTTGVTSVAAFTPIDLPRRPPRRSVRSRGRPALPGLLLAALGVLLVVAAETPDDAGREPVAVEVAEATPTP